MRLPAWAPIVGGIVLLALPVCIPVFTTSLIWGHDAFAYFPRLVEVHQNVTNGIVLPRWAPDLERGAGQPLFLFHPPMFYWLAEIWRLAGFEFVTSINLACALVALASAAGMFFLGRLYFGATGGFFAAAAYLYAPYFATDLYIRSALEEYTAFAFFPLALFGFGSYARHRNQGHLILGGAAYAGVVFCHLPATLLFSPLLAAFLCLTAYIERSWRILCGHLLGLILGVGLSACIWIPVVLERQHVSLTRATEGYGHYSNHFIYLHQLFYSPWGYGISVQGPNDGMPFSVGWSHLLLATIVWIWSSRQPKLVDRRLIRFFAFAGIVMCALTLAYISTIWKVIPALQYVQLPWRLLGAVSVCSAMLAGALSPMLSALPRYRKIVLAAVFALLIGPNLNHLRPAATQDLDPTFWTPSELARTGFETTTMRELTPRWMQLGVPYNPRAATVVEGSAEIRQMDRTPFRWRGAVNAQTPARVEMSIAYFPGWSVRVDGHEIATTPAVPTGLLRFEVPPGAHRVEAVWVNSTPRMAGNTISGIALVLLLVWRWASRERN